MTLGKPPTRDLAVALAGADQRLWRGPRPAAVHGTADLAGAAHEGMQEARFQRGDLVDWHNHPGFALLAVNAGTMTFYDPDCSALLVRDSSRSSQPNGTHHGDFRLPRTSHRPALRAKRDLRDLHGSGAAQRPGCVGESRLNFGIGPN